MHTVIYSIARHQDYTRKVRSDQHTEKARYTHAKKNEAESVPYSIIKINSVKTLTRLKPAKFLQEKVK